MATVPDTIPSGSNETTVIVSAPGKVIISGEHAVVYGRPALATALDLRLRIRLERCSTNTIALISQTFSVSLALEKYNQWYAELRPLSVDQRIPLIVERVSEEFEGYCSNAICSISALVYCCVDLYRDIPSLSITITSDIPLGAGLGSSAALSSALSGAILIDSGDLELSTSNVEQHHFTNDQKLRVNDLSRICERFFHGNPSGIDNTVVTFGGAILWHNGEFEQIPVINSPRVLVVETHVERSTAQLVESVRRRRERQLAVVDSICDSMSHIVHRWVSLLTTDNILDSYVTGRELFEMNQHLLAALGVSHASLDAIISAACEVGLAGKLTGAGGGGCALVLLPPSGMSTPNGNQEDCEAQIAVLTQLLNQKGFTSIEANIAEPGIKLESFFQTERS